MASVRFRFDEFELDPDERRLQRDGATVELNGRYLDALILLVGEHGRLISKDRFMAEIWRGVPVTDEALTQCIRTLRRVLEDDARRPRFIETSPRYGYRFIAAVETGGPPSRPETAATAPLGWRRIVRRGGAGTLGGAAAGAAGGLFYGLIGAAGPLQPGTEAVSVLLVLLCLTAGIATVGAAGVAFGIATADAVSGRSGPWSIAGGAVGGVVVGAVVKLLGLDAFELLFGQSPGDITGAPEGLALGAALGLGAWLAATGPLARSSGRGLAAAGAAGALAGALIPLLGGRLMGGSLDLLARGFPGSRLRLDPVGGLFGEAGLGAIGQVLTGGLEGLLFAVGVVGAMRMVDRAIGQAPR